MSSQSSDKKMIKYLADSLGQESLGDLVEAWTQKKPEAIKYIYDKFFNENVGIAVQLIGDHHLALDFVSHVFYKLLIGQPSFTTEGDIKAFLLVSTRNICYDHLRRVKVHKRAIKEIQFLSSINGEINDFYNDEGRYDKLMPIIYAGIDNLPPERRRIFKMLFYDQISPKKIAELLNISVKTVRSQKDKAIEYLKKLLLKPPDIC